MDIKDLELIRAVCETGSLSRACNQLHMSQPTLSKKLSRLEDQLRTPLFHRYPKGLVPTDVALYILGKAEPLRAQLAEIERHIDLMTQLDKGRLTLGVGPIIEQVLLPEVLDSFVATTGDVELSIVTEDEATLLSLFAASELDVVVGPFRVEDQASEHVVAIPMISDDIVAVARTDHPVFDEQVDLDALVDYSWVAPRAQGSVQMAGDHPVFRKMKILSDNYNLLKRLTLSSELICAGPMGVFKSEIEAGLLRELQVPLDITWTSALLIKPETLATPLASHLVTIFKSATANHPQVI